MRYSIFRIDAKGISGEIIGDDAGELTERYHRVIKQKLIKPDYLEFVCEKDTIYFEPTEWDYLKYELIDGMTRKEVDQKFLK